MSRAIDYLNKEIKKFNDRGDYYLGDELSHILDDMISLESQLKIAEDTLLRIQDGEAQPDSESCDSLWANKVAQKALEKLEKLRGDE